MRGAPCKRVICGNCRKGPEPGLDFGFIDGQVPVTPDPVRHPNAGASESAETFPGERALYPRPGGIPVAKAPPIARAAARPRRR